MKYKRVPYKLSVIPYIRLYNTVCFRMAAILHIIEMGWKITLENGDPDVIANAINPEISADTYRKARLLVVNSIQQRAVLFEVSLKIIFENRK